MKASRVRVASAATLGVLSVGLVMTSASATAWYSQSSPLKVTEDGVTQGAGYGNFSRNASYAISNSTRRDYKAGGDGIYVQTIYRYWYNPGTGGAQWNNGGSDQTGRTTSGSWVSEKETDALSPDGDRVRGVMDVAEDQSWSPDPRSASAFVTLNY